MHHVRTSVAGRDLASVVGRDLQVRRLLALAVLLLVFTLDTAAVTQAKPPAQTTTKPTTTSQVTTSANRPGPAKPTVNASGYMFLDFWFLAGYDYNTDDPFDPSPKQMKNTIPASILALNGKKVEIYGNILPLEYDTSGTSNFILNASVDACGFGGVPRINEWIYVEMKPGLKAKSYGAGYEVLVRGTFNIAEEVDQGRIVGLYSMVADSVK